MTATAHPRPADIEPRAFEPGTTGWSADDLDDPRIEAKWFAGRFEIIEGVLAQMAPAYFTGGHALFELMVILRSHFAIQKTPVRFSMEVDLVLDKRRVLRADAAMMTAQDDQKQKDAAEKAHGKNLKRTRILVPPTLVIESVSPGHESHDSELKLLWYAQFGIPNYWILDAFAERLSCLRLSGGSYVMDAEGSGNTVISPAAPAPLSIPLGELWSAMPKE